MSDIIEELMETFRSSSEKLEGLTESFDDLQKAQLLVEQLSTNLGDAAQSLQETAKAHNDFIQSASVTNVQLGEVVSVLKDLDTKSINASLSKIGKGIENNDNALSKITVTLTNTKNKTEETATEISKLTDKLKAVMDENKSLSSEFEKMRQEVIEKNDAASLLAGKRHKIILAFASTLILLHFFV